MYECDMSSEALTCFCDSLVFLQKSTLTENLVRVSLGEERGKNSVIYIFVLLSLFFYPLVALPHLRFTFSAINTKWEGDFQPDVWKVWRVWSLKSLKGSWSGNLLSKVFALCHLVALPHLRFRFSEINIKWEGDFQPDVWKVWRVWSLKSLKGLGSCNL